MNLLDGIVAFIEGAGLALVPLSLFWIGFSLQRLAAVAERVLPAEQGSLGDILFSAILNGIVSGR
jgi:hypothetical protein